MLKWHVLLENKWSFFSGASGVRQQPQPPLFLLKMYPVLSDLGWDSFRNYISAHTGGCKID